MLFITSGVCSASGADLLFYKIVYFIESQYLQYKNTSGAGENHRAMGKQSDRRIALNPLKISGKNSRHVQFYRAVIFRSKRIQFSLNITEQ